jgi:hypothetical protein
LKIGRRKFLSVGSAALLGLTLKADRRIEGSFVNESAAAGHLLRDRASFTSPQKIEKFSIVIVGGGISGLSAAWRLRKRGFKDFVVLEMNSQAGGNARWGENEITAYPWAAHYVPVPGPRATYVRELFTDLGVLKDGRWEERNLVFAPQERLFLYGRWQDSLEPAVGLTQKDREQFQRLQDVLAKYRATGEFTIPLELGLTGKFAELDQISFADWLASRGFDSRALNWYMNYACRDDYGALTRDTSAWAGIHYFASREMEELGPLTWPEGNGWITRRLLERVGENVRTGQMVNKIIQSNRGVTVLAGVSRAVPDRRFSKAKKLRVLALAHGELDVGTAAGIAWSRAHLGYCFHGLANIGLCRCNPSECAHVRPANGLDVLLGTCRWNPSPESTIPIGKGLELLEGGDPPGLGTRSHRYSAMCFAHGCYADGTCYDPSVDRRNFVRRSRKSEAETWSCGFCEF